MSIPVVNNGMSGNIHVINPKIHVCFSEEENLATCHFQARHM